MGPARGRIYRQLTHLLPALAAAAFVVLGVAAPPSDAAGGTITVQLVQTSADAGGNRTAAAGATFGYSLGITCSGGQGDCLTGGQVTLDLSAWRSFAVTLGSPDGDVTAAAWDPGSGIVTLTLADILATEGSTSFTWAPAITIATPPAVPALPAPLALTARLAGDDGASATSNTVTSTLTAVAPALSLAKGTTTPFPAPGRAAVWTLSRTSTPAAGILIPQSTAVTDTLPAGVTLVSCPPAASCSPDGRTITWTPNPASATATLTVQTIVDDDAPPGAVITNSAALRTVHADGAIEDDADDAAITVTALPDLPPGVTINKSVFNSQLRVRVGSSELPASYIGDWADNGPSVNTEVSYQVDAGFGPYGGGAVTEMTLSDDLPCIDTANPAAGAIYASATAGSCAIPAFTLTSVTTNLTGAVLPSGAGAPQAVLADGQTISLILDASSASAASGRWNVPAPAIGHVVRVVLPRDANGLRFTGEQGGSVTLILAGYPTPGVGLKNADILRNSGTTVGIYQPGGADPVVSARQSFAADVRIVDGTALMSASKTLASPAGAPSAQWTIGGTFTYADAGADDDLAGPYVAISDLWPSDLPIPASLLAGDTQWQGRAAEFLPSSTAPLLWSGPPEVTYNVTDSQHRLTWRIPIAVLNQLLDASPRRTASLTAALPAAPAAAPDGPGPGSYTNTAVVQLSAADNPTGLAGGTTSSAPIAPVPDVLDLDGDPSTQWYQQATSTYTLQPAPGSTSFRVNAKVRGDADDTFRSSPHVGSIGAVDGTAGYQLSWTNNGATALTDSVLYDLLPGVGDVEAIAGAAGRGSTFPVALASVDATPAGVTLAYSTSLNPCRPELGVGSGCDDDWSAAAPADLRTVTALRWTNANSYAFNQGWTVSIAVSIPTRIDADDIAWNSAGATASRADTGDRLIGVESPKVGLSLALEPGWLRWTKTDPSGALLPGSAWRVVAVSPEGAPLTGAAAFDQTVADNGAGDADDDAGRILVGGLLAGVDYRVTEATAPDGYVLDGAPHLLVGAAAADGDAPAFLNAPTQTDDPEPPQDPTPDPPQTPEPTQTPEPPDPRASPPDGPRTDAARPTAPPGAAQADDPGGADPDGSAARAGGLARTGPPAPLARSLSAALIVLLAGAAATLIGKRRTIRRGRPR